MIFLINIMSYVNETNRGADNQS